MQFPTVEIVPGEGIHRAAEKVERAFEAAGGTLHAFHSLNRLLEISAFCQFYQVEVDGRQCVVVVMTEPWDERTLLIVLNVLLQVQIDPDPPGSRLAFQFYSAHEVPEIFSTLFGDSPVCEFESRASLVSRFGNELHPEECCQLAAVAVLLSRECFSVQTDVLKGSACEQIEHIVCDHVRPAKLAVDPLNSLIVLGCLYGESVRSSLGYPTRWGVVEQYQPWPGLLLRRPDRHLKPPDAQGNERTRTETQQVAFNPIAHVIRLYKTGERGQLSAATEKLRTQCIATLGRATAGTDRRGTAS